MTSDMRYRNNTLSGTWRVIHRTVALCTVLVLVGAACGSGDDATLAAGERIDPTGCDESGLVSRINHYERITSYATWVVLESATVVLADAPGVPAEAAETAKEFGDEPTPRYAIFDMKATPLRGESPTWLTAEGEVGEGVRRALADGREVWIAVNIAPEGMRWGPTAHLAVEFDDTGRATFLGNCAHEYYGAGVGPSHTRARDDAGEVIPAMERDFLAEAIRDPGGVVDAAFARTVVFESPTWWDYPEDLRSVDDPVFTPPEVLAGLRSIPWVITIGEAIRDGDKWLLCPRAGPGWSSCASIAGIPADRPLTLSVLVPKDTEADVEIWLVPDDEGFLAARDRVVATVTVTPTDNLIALDIATADIDELNLDADIITASAQ